MTRMNHGGIPLKGDRVQIYEDPMTRQKPEGIAIVIKVLKTEEIDKCVRHSRIKCRFESDAPGDTVERVYVWAAD